jgi:aspartate-semialdehyde dehydrogenase
MNKIPVGILGATGMVGQRLITLLAHHPWFEVKAVAASPNSAGKTYEEAVSQKWVMNETIPSDVAALTVSAVERDMKHIASEVSFVFSALDMEKEKIIEIENSFAVLGVGVVSNNSAHRWTDDVPMIIPEINSEHISLIDIQRQRRGLDKGFIVVKPNCSIQSYVPPLTALLQFEPQKVVVTTLQAVSGAGKTLQNWPEMQANVIPFIGGEEQKSEKEPLKVWGKLTDGKIELYQGITISATCIRVPVQDGHMASVAVSFAKKPTPDEIIEAWNNFKTPLDNLNLPSSPKPLLTVFTEENRPQTRLDRDLGNGMGISMGRLRQDTILDYKFIGLSHNTVRGAAGGSVLTAELLKQKGYIYG